MNIYRIVQSDNVYELQEMVMSLLNTGWQCQGGVTSCEWSRLHNGVRIMYSQAVIKDDTESIPLSEMII